MIYTGHDTALNPPVFLYRPDNPDYYLDTAYYVAAPAVAVTDTGRIWMSVCTGGQGEDHANILALSCSDDDGLTWDECVWAIAHRDTVRIHDPLVWRTPKGQIILSWNQSYEHWDGRGGVWISVLENPDSDHPTLTEPRRLCDGVMANPPAFREDGAWLLPIAVWKLSIKYIYDLPDLQHAMIWISRDAGKTVELLGKADITENCGDEHNIVPLSDGTMMMLARTEYGWGCSYSHDSGHTWTPGTPYRNGPSVKSCLRTLPDGRLIWATYDTNRPVRERIVARISGDDGKTWPYSMLLDAREEVSYTNICVCDNGSIYITHDFQRMGAKEAILHKVTPADIEAGKIVTEGSYIGRQAIRNHKHL